jgi:hypothetical protein
VKTTFGAVSLEGIGGAITVDNANGSVSATALPSSAVACHNVSIKTSFSPLQIRLPENAGYTLTARTSFGRINSELPVTTTGTVSPETLSGKIGNGGCTLSLTNANSSIEILKLSK